MNKGAVEDAPLSGLKDEGGDQRSADDVCISSASRIRSPTEVGAVTMAVRGSQDDKEDVLARHVR